MRFLKIGHEMTHAAESDAGADLFDAEVSSFQKMPGMLHPKILEIFGQRLAGLLAEQPSKVRRRQMDRPGQFADG